MRNIPEKCFSINRFGDHEHKYHFVIGTMYPKINGKVPIEVEDNYD